MPAPARADRMVVMLQNTQQEIWDIHTHCLPGIDDGARDWDMTMQMLQVSREAGVRVVIATPHYLPWRDPLPAGTVEGLCAEAMDRSSRELGIDIRILPGQELYYHDALIEDLRTGRALTLAGSRYVLVEFSERAVWTELETGLIRLCRSGFRPVLAHVERYECLWRGDRLRELISRGVLLQSNAQEVEGGFLNRMTRRVAGACRRGEIDFVASDMHNMDSRPPLSDRQLRWFRKNTDAAYFRQLFGDGIRERLADRIQI